MKKQAQKAQAPAKAAQNAHKPAAQHDVAKRTDTLRGIMINAAKAQNSLDKAVGSVSNDLLVLAKSFQETRTILLNHTGDRVEENSEKFHTACVLEEQYIKSKEAGRLQRDTLPKCWTQAKSNIKAALEYGIDLALYDSESALRKEVQRVRGLKSTANPVDQAINDLKKSVKALSQDKAIKILAEAMAYVNAALEESLADDATDTAPATTTIAPSKIKVRDPKTKAGSDRADVPNIEDEEYEASDLEVIEALEQQLVG